MDTESNSSNASVDQENTDNLLDATDRRKPAIR